MVEMQNAGRVPKARSIRDIKELHRRVRQMEAADTPSSSLPDGWCRPLHGLGFRYDYDINIARGGWEYYALGTGLGMIVTDMVAATPIPRRHDMNGHLVLSAMVDGVIPLSHARGTDAVGPMAHGFCTLYGLSEGDELETLYEPGKHLRWLSIVVERELFFEATGLDAADIPTDIAEFLCNGVSLSPRNVPISHQASLAIQQLLQCPFDRSLRGAYLRVKTLELIFHLFATIMTPPEESATDILTPADIAKLDTAMRIIRSNLSGPLSVTELCTCVGLTRRRLQLGFRQIYGDTVCNVRDRLRMELAFELVNDSSMSMIEIAMEAGYDHPASFSRAFRSAFGMSPIMARQAARESLVERRRRDRTKPRRAPAA
ncbi:helix-turn-helix transcriptional regulator [Flavisphingomonas formosensis]|uniref:helix-turn-helix transcriptional regulator n=1 Tax=Flavisphingomonas formosensis TaxID=861534 RepID=UPI0012F80312|nr:AraC family transcriptional regulator [Sphingomonas formosensis]